MELRLTTWEFVRLMVQCEETRKSSPTASVNLIWQSWSDMWYDLDKELDTLAEKDFDAFSTMMMEQEVVIESITEDQLSAVIGELKNVKTAMQTALDEADLHPDVRDAMTYEVEELTQRIKTLLA